MTTSPGHASRPRPFIDHEKPRRLCHRVVDQAVVHRLDRNRVDEVHEYPLVGQSLRRLTRGPLHGAPCNDGRGIPLTHHPARQDRSARRGASSPVCRNVVQRTVLEKNHRIAHLDRFDQGAPAHPRHCSERPRGYPERCSGFLRWIACARDRTTCLPSPRASAAPAEAASSIDAGSAISRCRSPPRCPRRRGSRPSRSRRSTRSPATAAPSAMPVSAFSEIGVSMTRSAPYRSRNP